MEIIKKILFYGLILGLLPIFQSCNDDRNLDENYYIDIATIKTIEPNQYYIELDSDKTLWPSGTLIPNYQPEDGQRVLADFTVLDEISEGYDYAVRINSIYNIRTESIEDLNAENQEEFGNDPINIPLGGIWVSSHYLNIEFLMYTPINTKHRISLVKNTMVTPDDGSYLHLELRYNTYDDVSSYVNRGIVSFDLGEGENGVSSKHKGVVLKINSAVNGFKDLVFDYSDEKPVAPSAVKNISMYLK